MSSSLRWSPTPPRASELLEAIYRVDSPIEGWLQGMLGVLVHSLSGAGAVNALTYSLSPGGAFELGNFFEWGGGQWKVSALLPISRRWDPESMKAIVTRPCYTLSEFDRSERNVAHAALEMEALGIADIWGINGFQTERPGGVLLGALSTTTIEVPPQDAPLWSLIAAHLGVAFRLRHRLSAARANVEAVLSPDGSLAHAEPQASAREDRHALRKATRDIDLARSRYRRRPDEALRAWQAVVSGRWTLVDQVDTDGRRFVVARVNDPSAPGPAALTARERQVCVYAALGHANKLIACELGLSMSTVAGHLARAARKLGVGSRVELVRRVRSMVPPDDR